MIPENVGSPPTACPRLWLNVGFDPQLNAQIPLDAAFHLTRWGSREAARLLRQEAHRARFVYYNCPMLCSQVEQAVVGSLKMIFFPSIRERTTGVVHQFRHDGHSGCQPQEKHEAIVAVRAPRDAGRLAFSDRQQRNRLTRSRRRPISASASTRSHKSSRMPAASCF